MKDDPRFTAARLNHTKTTGHKNIMVGMNFIECPECHAHAHISSNHETLILHDSGYQIVKEIQPSEF